MAGLPTDIWRGLALGAVTTLAVASALLGGHNFALALAPLVLLVASLICGYFPGHTLIEAATRRPRRRFRLVRELRPRRRSAPRMLAHGGTLIATSIASRPPPVPLTAH